MFYKTNPKMGKNKFIVPALFLLTAIAGIAMFISSWNSYILGKEKIYLSMGFMILFLIGLLLLFFQFSKIIFDFNNINSSEVEKITSSLTELERQKKEEPLNKDSSFKLLKDSFNKSDARITGEKILKNLAFEFEILQGVFFTLIPESGKYTCSASFALGFDKLPLDFESGEGITGQAAADNKILVINNLPESYSPVISGLGTGKARFLYIIPLVYNKKSYGVIEISTFKEIEETRMPLLNQLMHQGGLQMKSFLFPEPK
jgi:hypothetical protein